MNVVPDCAIKSLKSMELGEIAVLADGKLGIVAEFDASNGNAVKHIIGFPNKARGLISHHIVTPDDLDDFHALSMGKDFDIRFDPTAKGIRSTEGTRPTPGNLVLDDGKLLIVVDRPDNGRYHPNFEFIIRRSVQYRSNMFGQGFVISHWEVRHAPPYHDLPPIFSC